MTRQWEYLAITKAKMDGELKELNDLGQQGWELVALAGQPGKYTMMAVLKREITADAA
jgi:Domain of unknown function (DUF4177)